MHITSKNCFNYRELHPLIDQPLANTYSDQRCMTRGLPLDPARSKPQTSIIGSR